MVNFGIIGCGKIGVRHINFLKGIDGTKILAVADTIEERAKNAADSYNSTTKIFTDYKELLKMSEIDIVHICTPSGLHAQMCIDALNAGKHVLCEKPLCLNVKDADNVIEAAKRSNKKMFVVKQNRFNVPIRILRDALDKGMFGKLYSINANVIWNRRPEYYQEADWRGTKELDGGALMTQASHFVDMLQWIGGSVKSVFAKTDKFLHNIETEDTGVLILRFESGALGTIYYTTCAYDKNIEGSITVLGTKGSAKIGGEYLNKMEHWNVHGYPLPEHNSTEEVYPKSTKHDAVFRETIKKIIGDENASIVDTLEARKTVEIIEAVHLSAKTGKEIFLPLKEEDIQTPLSKSLISESSPAENKTNTYDYSDYLSTINKLTKK